MNNQPLNYHYVNSDRELLNLLFKQLNINNFSDLLDLMKKHNIDNFKDLLDFASGPDCSGDLALTVEVLIDRIRRTDPRRSKNWNTSSKIGSYIAEKLIGKKQEQFWVFYFDQQQNLIAEKMLFQGTLNKSWVHPREIFRWAVIYGCANIIVAHNHPSGSLIPSKNDLEMTQGLKEASQLMKIGLLDHFIVGNGEYLSMREQQMF